MCKVKLDETKFKVLEVVQKVPFTLVRCEYTHDIPAMQDGLIHRDASSKVYWGTGLAKQGHDDRFKEEIGRNIAISRAKKAIWSKMHGKKVNLTFAG